MLIKFLLNGATKYQLVAPELCCNWHVTYWSDGYVWIKGFRFPGWHGLDLYADRHKARQLYSIVPGASLVDGVLDAVEQSDSVALVFKLTIKPWPSRRPKKGIGRRRGLSLKR